MKIIALLMASLFLSLHTFGLEKRLEDTRETHLNALEKNKDSILGLYDVVSLYEIKNYFDDQQIENKLLNFKSKNQTLNAYVDLFKYAIDKQHKIGYANHYYMIGPFENQNNIGFSKQYPPELEFDLNKKYEGKNQEVFWKEAKDYEASFLNFRNFINKSNDSLSYLLVFVKVKKSGQYQLRLGVHNFYELFLDKKRIFKSEVRNPNTYDRQIFDLYLEKGVHEVLLKVDRKYGSWYGAYLRVLNKHGVYNHQEIEFLSLKKEPKLAKSSYRGINKALEKQLDAIKVRDFNYYFKRIFIEEEFLSYDLNIKPFPYEQYFEVMLKKAKTKEEKGRAYKMAYEYHSTPDDNEKYLNQSADLDFLPALITKIDLLIERRSLHLVPKLIEKALRLAPDYYSLWLSMYEYYEALGLSYSEHFKRRYKASKQTSKYFSFLMDSVLYENSQKMLEISEKNQNEHFFTDENRFDLLNLYGKYLQNEKYEALLKRLLKKRHLSYVYNTTMLEYLFSNERYQELLELYKKRENLLSDSYEALKLVARTYQILNKKEKSIEYYKKYIKLYPNDTKISDFLNHYEQNKMDLWAENYIKEIQKEDEAYQEDKQDKAPFKHVYHHTIVKINKDYSFSLYKKMAIAIQREEIASNFTSFPIYYLPDESIAQSTLKVIRKNKEVEEVNAFRDRYFRSKSNGAFMNYSIRRYQLPKLEKGDVIEVAYYLENDNVYEHPFYASVYNIEASVPNDRMTFTFLSQDLKLNFNKKPTEEKEGRYFFEFKDVKEVKKELRSTGYSSNYQYLSTSTMQTWQELVHWYKGLLFKQNILTNQVKNEVLEGTKKLKTLEEKVKWVHQYVFDHTHYVGIELGLNAYKPFSVMEVLERKYGDCKDKANLFNTLLHLLGIKAEMVLVRTNPLGKIMDEFPPNPRYFNHAISYLPELDIYVDMTAEKNGLFDLPFSDQDATGIIIRDKESIKTLPTIEAKMFVSINGEKKGHDLSAKVDLTYKGSLGAGMRYRFENKELRKDYLLGMLKPLFPSLEIKSFVFTDFKDVNKDLKVSVTLLAKNFFKNKTLFSSLWIKNMLEREVLVSKRTEGYKTLRKLIKEDIRIKGLDIQAFFPKTSFRLDKKDIFYDSNMQKTKEGVVIKNTFTYKTFGIKQEAYKAYVHGISEVSDFMKNNTVNLKGDKE